MNVHGLAWLGTRTAEFDGMVAFLKDVFGLTPAIDEPGPNQELLLAKGGVGCDWDPQQSCPPGIQKATFNGPSSGEWIVLAFVQFAVGGDAAYYWHVHVQ